MQEFFDECSKMGYHAPKEVEVKDETIDLLLPQNFKPTSAAQWASVIEKLNALHKEEPSEQPLTVGTDRGLSLEQPARYTGTFGCHGLGGALRGAIGLFHATQGYDNNVEAIKSVAQTFPRMVQHGDIRELKDPQSKFKPTDLFHCGPPCQAFSPLGFLQGLSDHRGALYLETARMAVSMGFKIIIVEMVSNIIRFCGGIVQHIMMQIFAEAGYEVSLDYDISFRHGNLQTRRRIYTIVTNPRYGPHELLKPVVPLRTADHPTSMGDIMLPLEQIESDLWLPQDSMRVNAAPNTKPGQPRVAGYRGKGDRQSDRDPGVVYHHAGGCPSMTRNFLGWLRKENVITRLHLIEALRVFGLEDTTPLPKDRDKATELIANTEPVALAKAHLLQAHQWLEDTAELRVGLPDGLTPEPRTKHAADEITENWINH